MPDINNTSLPFGELPEIPTSASPTTPGTVQPIKFIRRRKLDKSFTKLVESFMDASKKRNRGLIIKEVYVFKKDNPHRCLLNHDRFANIRITYSKARVINEDRRTRVTWVTFSEYYNTTSMFEFLQQHLMYQYSLIHEGINTIDAVLDTKKANFEFRQTLAREFSNSISSALCS